MPQGRAFPFVATDIGHHVRIQSLKARGVLDAGNKIYAKCTQPVFSISKGDLEKVPGSPFRQASRRRTHQALFHGLFSSRNGLSSSTGASLSASCRPGTYDGICRFSSPFLASALSRRPLSVDHGGAARTAQLRNMDRIESTGSSRQDRVRTASLALACVSTCLPSH
jgi:hypothetical protein